MYLIDRWRGQVSEDMTLNSPPFEQLMHEVYVTAGERPSRNMSNCLWDINKAVRTACRTLNVPPSPYMVNGIKERLYVLKADISLPEELT